MTPNVVDMGSVKLVTEVAPKVESVKVERVTKRGKPSAKPFKVDHRRAAEALSIVRGQPIDPAKVALKLADTDVTPLYESSRNRVEWVIWDHKSPINGVSAKEVEARYPRADEVYLLEVDGKVVFFQPHAPHVEGLAPLSKSVVEATAEQHAVEIVDHMAFDAVVDSLKDDPDLVVSSELDIQEVVSQVLASQRGGPRSQSARR